MKRTISSLALLRMNWDSYNRDYIEIFIPFIVTLISKKKYQIIEVEILRKDFESEYGLKLPYHPTITMLRRAKKRGYIEQKSDKDFVPVKNLVEADQFSESALLLERKYNNVSSKFIAFCHQYGLKIDADSADRILISFLKDHDLDIIFANQDLQTLLPEVNTTEQEKFLISKFIQEAYISEPETFRFVVDISMGHIIANAILYDSDFEKFQGKIVSNCYLDTGIIFDVLGINEEAKQNASKELIQSLSKNGANFFVFRHTYEEILGILNGCIEWVRSPHYDPAKASRAARYFKDNNFTPSEVESFILSIERRVNEFKIIIVDSPNLNDSRSQRFLIDENSLLEKIVSSYKFHNPYFDETEKDFTLYQDIKSISAVNVLRRGEKPLSLSVVKHVFVTSNSTLAYSNRQFEIATMEGEDKNAGFFFIPAAITDVLIGTLLWAQSPANFEAINQKRLIANCYAALQPTKNLLRKFTLAAERELEKGNITSDEYSLLKSSRVARNVLVEETLNDANLLTESSIPEILNGIKNIYKKEEESKFAKRKEQFEIAEEKSKTAIQQKEEAIENERKLKVEAEEKARRAEKALKEKEVKESRDKEMYMSIFAGLISIILISAFELAIHLIPIDLIVSHSHSTLLQVAVDTAILLTIVAMFLPKWRKTVITTEVILFIIGSVLTIYLTPK